MPEATAPIPARIDDSAAGGSRTLRSQSAVGSCSGSCLGRKERRARVILNNYPNNYPVVVVTQLMHAECLACAATTMLALESGASNIARWQNVAARGLRKLLNVDFSRKPCEYTPGQDRTGDLQRVRLTS